MATLSVVTLGFCPSNIPSRATSQSCLVAAPSAGHYDSEDDLAMEALKNLTTNIPDWVKRLDDLNGQIAQRQLDLAKLTESRVKGSSGSAAPRSMKNRSSTESLKPTDDAVAHPGAEPRTEKASEVPASDAAIHPPLERPQRQASRGAAAQPPSSPDSDGMSRSPSALQRQTNQVMAAAQAKARATLRKRNRTESMMSAEDAPKYRTRSMIIVYYDSYVQSFFEELVKFVSASRNLMRKAKMAAKVAQIKKMAELDMPDDEDDDQAKDEAFDPSAPLSLTPDAPLVALSKKGEEGEGEEELPTLRYISTRQMRQVSRSPGMMGPARSPYSRVGARFGGGAALMAGGEPAQSDVCDELDKGLEAVQSLCERAAHQFLRDGDCAEEIDTIKKRLGQTKELSDKEVERIRKEDPDAVKDEATKTRSFRPHSMRLPSAGSSPSKESAQPDSGPLVLEVDEGLDDMDNPPPKLVFKSTRAMR